MELRRNSVLMLSAPAVAAVLIGALLVTGPLQYSTDKLGEGLAATGYVTISVVRDGNEVYHYEDHNMITEDGIDFLVQQVSGTPVDDEEARWIALTSSDIEANGDDDDSALAGEITSGGLERVLGNLTYTAGNDDDDDNYTITATFTASANHNGVQGAGLFTGPVVGTPGNNDDDGTMFAQNDFSDVNLADGDQLTITWTIDLGIYP